MSMVLGILRCVAKIGDTTGKAALPGEVATFSQAGRNDKQGDGLNGRYGNKNSGFGQ